MAAISFKSSVDHGIVIRSRVRAEERAPALGPPITKSTAADVVKPEIDAATELRSAIEVLFQAEIQRVTEISEATGDVVTRKYDRATGDLVGQFPQESLLRLRALIRGIEGSGKS